MAPVDQAALKAQKMQDFLKIRKEKADKAKVLSAELKQRAEEFNAEYLEQLKKEREMRLDLKSKGLALPEKPPKILFVIRIRGINKLPPKPKMILRLFRLLQINNGIFLKVNKATTEMLKFVLPYVTFGSPSLKVIRHLIYKRGYGKVGPSGGRQRIRLSDNSMIHQHLGKYGVHGLDDIIKEIFTAGENFKQVNNFLWPFKLSNPKKGFVAKRHGFTEWTGGDWGDRGDLINDLLLRMI